MRSLSVAMLLLIFPSLAFGDNPSVKTLNIETVILGEESNQVAWKKSDSFNIAVAEPFTIKFDTGGNIARILFTLHHLGDERYTLIAQSQILWKRPDGDVEYFASVRSQMIDKMTPVLFYPLGGRDKKQKGHRMRMTIALSDPS